MLTTAYYCLLLLTTAYYYCLLGANINRSLLALGNCINALADRSKRASPTL